MKNLTFKQFRYFEALAREGHFGRAAEVCSISQPALSLQIKDLEDSLGVPVFERGSRHVRLTAFGEIFRARVQTILQAVDELDDLARTARRQPFSRLRLGVIPTVAPYLLPKIIGDLLAAFPGLDLNIRESVTPKLTQELAEGRLDAAIVALPIPDPAFTEWPLLTEDFVLLRPQSEANTPVPDIDTLKTMRLLLLEEGHCFRDQALAFCGIDTTRPREMLEGSTLATLVQMVGAGIGVTLIPAMAVPVETRAAAVAVSPFEGLKPNRRIGMIWRKSNPLGSGLQDIGAIIHQSLASQPETTSR